ncbi:MAG: CRISPR-associated protein Csx3 [Thermoanaerobaculia bacterium]
MTTFSIVHETTPIAGIDATLLRLAFGEPATNDAIVRDVERRMRELKDGGLRGGKLVLLNGAASLPAISVIVHHVAHLFGAVGVFDPKLRAYVIVVSHDPAWTVGEVLDVGERE